MGLNELTITQALKGLKEKKFSAVELTRACVARIRKVEPKINAFITVCEKKALNQAQKADNLRQKGSLQPLLGIPFAIKDIFSTCGIKTTAGSKVLENYIPVYDATAVKKLKKAGAIIIGKTNLDAWALGSSGENSDFGPTKNPWDLTRVSGGTSSGSAAAVAADMCLAATGTDTGGSVRLPAAFCGVVGLKPTYGRVSRYGVIAAASSLDTIGHLAKNVTDAAIILNITAGKDLLDATMPPKVVPDYSQNINQPIRGLKIGLPKEYFIKGLNSKIKQSLVVALAKMEKLGAKISEISLPHTKYALAAYYIIQPSEVSSNLARYDGIRYGLSRKKFADEAKRRIMLGTYTLSAGYYEAYYLQAMKVRTLIKKDFDNAFKKVDLIITPVSPDLPFKLGEKVDNPLKMYLSDIFTSTANLAGVPALSLPVGLVDNLPVGMQIIGPQFEEGRLFKLAFTCEQAIDWHQKKPKL